MNPLAKFLANYVFAKKKGEILLADNPDEDFIPFAIHFDKNTILTKNGELMQTIRVSGFASSSFLNNLIPLRDSIRDAIKDNIHKTNCAVWFHTIRRKKDISPAGEFHDFLSNKINDTWNEINNLHQGYVNELYITIVIEGLDNTIKNVKALSRTFSRFATKNLINNYLLNINDELSKVVTGILASINEYGAKILELTPNDGVIYSEQMHFFGKICNLEDRYYPLRANDISADLFFNKIAFTSKEINIISEDKKIVGGMLSLKEYIEIPNEDLDKILQMPFEFIITQCFDFMYSESELDFAKYQDNILRIGKNDDFRIMMGLTDFFENVKGNATDFGKLQTTIMIISDETENLNRDIKIISSKFQELGLILYREDIFLEDCFWSQLPGNFKYIKRQKVINSTRIAGFGSLYNYTTGTISGNYWGPAVCAFKSFQNNPYFFNFHDSDNGHGLFMGGKKSGKTVLLNFILAQSRRYNNKIFYFDFDNKAKNFVEMIGGFYYDLSYDIEDPKYGLKLNPFSQIHNSDFTKFLTEFFYSFIYYLKKEIPNNQIQEIPKICEKIVANKVDNFNDAVQYFNTPSTDKLYEFLNYWTKGDFEKIFNNNREINWNDRLMGFDYTEYRDKEFILVPILFYNLYRIENILDEKTPSIIVFKDANTLLNNEIFCDKIPHFLDRLRIKNCLAIFVFETEPDNHCFTKLFNLVAQKVSSKFILSDTNINSEIAKLLDLDDEEVKLSYKICPEDRKFILKFASSTLFLDFDLTKNKNLAKILSSSFEDIAIVEEIFNHAKQEGKIIDNQIAYNQFDEIHTALENEKIEQAKIKAREEKIARMRKLREIKE